jgi:hypothetical protein
MAAVVVGAIDQDASHARLAHLVEGDLLRPHAAIENYRFQALVLLLRSASTSAPVRAVRQNLDSGIPIFCHERDQVCFAFARVQEKRARDPNFAPASIAEITCTE